MFGQDDLTTQSGTQNDNTSFGSFADAAAAVNSAAEPVTTATTPDPVLDTPVVSPVADTSAPVVPIIDDTLLDIKQQALQQLSPLVGHLDQSPEEKFRTTMMMIQASDDQSLIKVAYEAAQEINDEKTRAQALLDVVNEINYFTQQQNQ